MKSTILSLPLLLAAAIGAPELCAQSSTLFADVYSPQIPARMELCGETIDLDRTDIFERIDRELTSMIYTHGSTLLIIKRANRFFPEMMPILRKEGVPEDLVYLACIESSLNPRAYSPAKAAGIWQFIASSAKEYGLEVNDEIDERYHLAKATRAAARYLKKAYARYGNWPSAFAAYNGGQARIAGAIDKQGQDTALDLYLAEETTRYPYRIMAMKAIMQRPSSFGFHLSENQLYQPRKYREVTVDGPVESWADWAKEQGISYATLREENPWIRSISLTNKAGKTYTVRIPLKESMSRKKAGNTTFNKNWVDR